MTVTWQELVEYLGIKDTPEGRAYAQRIYYPFIPIQSPQPESSTTMTTVNDHTPRTTLEHTMDCDFNALVTLHNSLSDDLRTIVLAMRSRAEGYSTTWNSRCSARNQHAQSLGFGLIFEPIEERRDPKQDVTFTVKLEDFGHRSQTEWNRYAYELVRHGAYGQGTPFSIVEITPVDRPGPARPIMDDYVGTVMHVRQWSVGYIREQISKLGQLIRDIVRDLNTHAIDEEWCSEWDRQREAFNAATNWPWFGARVEEVSASFYVPLGSEGSIDYDAITAALRSAGVTGTINFS